MHLRSILDEEEVLTEAESIKQKDTSLVGRHLYGVLFGGGYELSQITSTS